MSNGFVTAKLGGRLGNQLYVHSAAMALAIENDAEYLAYPKPDNQFEENYFRGCFPEWSGQPIEFEFNEPSTPYTEIPFKPNMCLNGYWQSYKLFEKHKDVIFPKFGIIPVIKKNTVAIHVRRGDYLTIIGKHAIPSDSYMKSAVLYFNKFGINRFFVCSDEINLAKELFNGFQDSEFTFSEGRTAIQDMAELAGCDHLIGSASTYTYWAHYLCQNPNKTLILPDNLWGVTHQHERQEFPLGTVKINNEGVIVGLA